MQQAINKVNKLFQWGKINIKTVKLRILMLLRGRVDPEVLFTIAKNNIPTVCDGPVKRLGRWNDSNLKDTS